MPGAWRPVAPRSGETHTIVFHANIEALTIGYGNGEVERALGATAASMPGRIPQCLSDCAEDHFGREHRKRGRALQPLVLQMPGYLLEIAPKFTLKLLL